MDDEKLINEVGKYPELYATNHRFFKDNIRKSSAWRKIADVISFSDNECRTRWKSLRDNYIKWKKRQQLPSGSGAIRQQEWKYAAAISFLDVFLQNRSTISNVDFENYMDGSIHEGDLDTQMISEEESPVPETAGTQSEEVLERPQRPRKKEETTQKVQTHKLMKNLWTF